MRRFQFRLETLLKHRKNLEEQREREYGEAQTRVDRAERRIKSLEQECYATLTQGRSASCRIDVASLLEREQYVSALKVQIAEVTQERDAALIVAEEARLALVKARQEREAVSKLRENALEEYQQESLRLDQEAFDEMAGLRFARQAHSGR
jgi:flagellar export protein FliJ